MKENIERLLLFYLDGSGENLEVTYDDGFKKKSRRLLPGLMIILRMFSYYNMQQSSRMESSSRYHL